QPVGDATVDAAWTSGPGYNGNLEHRVLLRVEVDHKCLKFEKLSCMSISSKFEIGKFIFELRHLGMLRPLHTRLSTSNLGIYATFRRSRSLSRVSQTRCDLLRWAGGAPGVFSP